MARKKEPELVSINQEKISQKAKELFKAKGFEATSMEEIAKEVDMSKTTLYVYFKSKEEIKNFLSLKAMKAFYQEFSIVKKYRKNTLYDIYMQVCNTLVELKQTYPDEFDIIVQNICFNEEALKENDVLNSTYETGEALNEIIFSLFEEILKKRKNGARIIFSQWGSIYGLITIAYNKEEYIKEKMNVTKEEFLKKGFEDLFISFNHSSPE